MLEKLRNNIDLCEKSRYHLYSWKETVKNSCRIKSNFTSLRLRCRKIKLLFQKHYFLHRESFILIHFVADIPLIPTMSNDNSNVSFVVHWLNNKEFHFTLESERLIEEVCRSRGVSEEPMSGLSKFRLFRILIFKLIELYWWQMVTISVVYITRISNNQ